MVNYRAPTTVFVILTIIFAAGTGYLVAFPMKTTTTQITTRLITTTVSSATLPTNTSTSFTVIIAHKSGIGYYLTNASGFTLYFRASDKPFNGSTTCTTAVCEKNWPVFYTMSLSLPPGLNTSNFSVITVYNGTKVLTFMGYPLYYWAHDANPGETTGQGIGGFYVATVPAPILPNATSTTTVSSTTTTIASSSSTSITTSSSTSVGYH